MARGIINTTKFRALLSLMLCTHLFWGTHLVLQAGVLWSVDSSRTTAGHTLAQGTKSLRQGSPWPRAASPAPAQLDFL